MTNELTIERTLRGIAGTVLTIAVALTVFHSPNWIWFVLFVAVNLLQSAFTNWCPVMTVLKKIK